MSAPDEQGTDALGRLHVVSYLALHPFEARGIRTRALLGPLAADWRVTVLAGPRPQSPKPLTSRARDRAQWALARWLTVDGFEFWSRRHLGSWTPDCDLAVLVGFPMSPVRAAAERLSAAGIPYIVDMSDPWVLTASTLTVPWLAKARSARAERRLWEGAAGAVLTTARQDRALRELFPHLKTLVRPNGYVRVEDRGAEAAAVSVEAPRDGECHIAHFGNLYRPRVEVAPLFERLVRSGIWSDIVFHQFGGDWNGTLATLPSEVRIEHHHPVDWQDVVAMSGRFDVALVVGNSDTSQLPSKVIDYLTLPIPRAAYVRDPRDDAISDYLADKPGWLVLGAANPDAGERLADHLGRTGADRSYLSPAPSEAWDAVGERVAAFVREVAADLR